MRLSLLLNKKLSCRREAALRVIQ